VVAGPWQFGKVDQGVIGLWVIAHLLERPLSYIGYGGKGKQVRDLLHVDDLCDLILAQIDHFEDWEGWLGNVAGGLDHSVSLCELTAKCQSVTGKSVPIREVEQTRPNDLRLFIGDCARLFARTAWRPRRNVDRLVEDVARWVTDHREALARMG
jgi:CDP-paratose 2-epimerase